ncbi:MAG: hypothetical protein Q8Q18_00345 [bacterium]|nr:hypothetical protein [bacterium]
MKSLSCDYCEAMIEGEDFDKWMETARAHYESMHADKLAGASEEDKAVWMAAAKEKFEAAE